MKTRTWILLFAVLAALCAALSIPLLSGGSAEPAALAQITSRGKIVATVELAVDQEFTVTAEDGHNVITVKGGKIAVTEATCPDHYCMKRGFCHSGADIVCLPNRLVIHFTAAQEIDALIG